MNISAGKIYRYWMVFVFHSGELHVFRQVFQKLPFFAHNPCSFDIRGVLDCIELFCDVAFFITSFHRR